MASLITDNRGHLSPCTGTVTLRDTGTPGTGAEVLQSTAQPVSRGPPNFVAQQLQTLEEERTQPAPQGGVTGQAAQQCPGTAMQEPREKNQAPRHPENHHGLSSTSSPRGTVLEG